MNKLILTCMGLFCINETAFAYSCMGNVEGLGHQYRFEYTPGETSGLLFDNESQIRLEECDTVTVPHSSGDDLCVSCTGYRHYYDEKGKFLYLDYYSLWGVIIKQTAELRIKLHNDSNWYTGILKCSD